MRLFGIPIPSFTTPRPAVAEARDNRFTGGQFPPRLPGSGLTDWTQGDHGQFATQDVNSWPFAGQFDAYEDAGRMVALWEPPMAQAAAQRTNLVQSWPFSGLQDYYEDSGWVTAGAELGSAVLLFSWPSREITGGGLDGGARHGDRSELDAFYSSLDPQYRWDGNRLVYGEDRQRWNLGQPILPTIYV